ncbi:MAG: hypothetical protein L6416_04255 [Candidatus Omnitrophica bacterium]|nr:hypothetical protein [Candidatus Omnitrophota bacterium]
MKGINIFRLTSIAVSILLMINGSIFAARGAPVQPKDVGIEDVLNIKIPSSWGIVRDSYNSGTDKLIINIQDAHCDFLAQENISKILGRLASEYRLKVVALEGASGRVENPVLSFFPQEDVKKEVSMYLVREGKLTGAEYLAITSDYGLKLYGVEDMRLYMDNLEAFQQSQPFKNEAKGYFVDLKQALDKLKPYLYNDGLKEYDALEEKYSSKRISFDEYVAALFRLMQKNGLNKVEYPTFFELQKAVELEAKVDFQKADTERTSLITELAQLIIDKQDISLLVEKSLNFKKGVVSAGAFAGYLKDLAFRMKLNMAGYPNFSAYEEYITKYEEVANENLFKELKQINTDLKNVLYTDAGQRQLDVLYQNLESLVKLVDIKMVNEDIEYFFKNRAQINSEEFRKFIEPQAYKHKLLIKLPPKISFLDVCIPAWAKFYELADMRDTAFIEKTLQYMDLDNENYAALITGGFHTGQLTRILKSKKISYIVIAPRASASGDSVYFNIMQGGKTRLEQFLLQLQSTLGPFIGGLDQSNLSDDLKSKNQEKLELQVESAAAIMAVNVIANSDTADGVKWGDVRTAVKEAINISFENSGMPLEQTEHLGAIVDNIINSLEKQESQGALQVSDGALTIDLGGGKSENVLVYGGVEGSKISVIAKADAPLVIASLGLTPDSGTPVAVNPALASDETTIADILLSKMESSDESSDMSLSDKVNVRVVLDEASSMLKSGAENQSVLSSLKVKLQDGGLSKQDTDDFISMIVVADTNLASNPVIVQAAKHVAVAIGLDSKDTKLMSTLQTGIARVISSDAGTKPEAVKQLANEINADAGTLWAVIDSEITVAGLSTNPVVAQAAKQVAVSIGLDEKDTGLMSTLQTGIAGVMSAPADTKQEAVAQLASEIGVSADKLVTFGNLIDTEVFVASLSVNPVIVLSAKKVAIKTGLDNADTGLMSTLQIGIARVISAPLGTKQEAVTQLANEINVNKDTLGSIIDTEVSTASLATSSITIQVAKQLARYLGITDPELIAEIMPVLQTGIADVMMSKTDAIQNLAKAIDKVDSKIDITKLDGKMMNAGLKDVNLYSNLITTLVSDQVVQELGLDPGVMPIVQIGIAEFMAAGTTTAKAKVADKIIAQISDMTGVDVIDRDTLVSIIDVKINSANLALNPVTVDAVEKLANKLGITESKMPEVMPVLQTGVANIMLAVLKSKTEATKQLAQSISSDLSSPVETDVLGSVVDLQINKSTMAANPTTVTASEQIAEDIGIGEELKAEMLPIIQANVAQIMSAQSPETKTLAMDSLIAALSTRTEVAQTKAELKETINNSITAASVTAAAEFAMPAQINTAQLSETADNLQVKLLSEAGLTPEVVVRVKQNINVGAHEGVSFTKQNMPQEIDTAIKDAGFTGDVKVKISSSRKGQVLAESKMNIRVLRIEDNSADITITFDNFDTNSKDQISKIRNSHENKETGLLLDTNEAKHLDLFTAMKDQGKAKVTLERTLFSEEIKEKQSLLDFIAIDETMFAAAAGEVLTEKVFKTRLSGLMSQQMVTDVTEGGTTKFMLTQNNSLSVKLESGETVTANLDSLLLQIGLSPNDFIIVDSNTSAAMQNSENPLPVTNEIILAVAENIGKKSNAKVRVHRVVPNDKETVAELIKFQAANDNVTFSVFEKNIGSKQIRNGDAIVLRALGILSGTEKVEVGSRKAFARAILATIKIDMSQKDLESLLGETYESTSMGLIITLDKDIELLIAAETWA